jgi:lactate permease
MDVTTLALAGAAPIAAVFVLMAGLRWSAARAMAVGWALAAALGLALWRMEPAWLAAAAVYGALQALEIVLIIFGAILLMLHLSASGALDTIRAHITGLVADRRIQVLLIGMGFMMVIEGAAGFGTPGALAAPLLIGLGFPPLAAVVFGLVFNAPQPPFGAAGTPVIGGVGAVVDEQVLVGEMTPAAFLDGVSGWTGVVTGAVLVAWGLFAVFLLLLWFGRGEERSFGGALRGVLPVAPFALLLGVLGGGVQFAVAWLFGPELPDIASGFVVLGVGALLARRGVLVPKEAWAFAPAGEWPPHWSGGLAPAGAATGASGGADPAADHEGHAGTTGAQDAGSPAAAVSAAAPPERQMSVLMAWTPYLLVALVLLVTRWPGLDLAAVLRSYSLDIERVLGQDLSYSLRPLYLPGSCRSSPSRC